MNCSPDMAASLFNKWREEITFVLIVLAGVGFKVHTFGLVEASSPDELLLSLANGGRLIYHLKGASYDYAEPREAPPDIREETEAMVNCALQVKFPDMTLALSEMREQPVIDKTA